MSPGTKETMASLRHLYPIRDQESEQIICWGLFLQFENMQGDSTMLPSGGFSMSHELFNTYRSCQIGVKAIIPSVTLKSV